MRYTDKLSIIKQSLLAFVMTLLVLSATHAANFVTLKAYASEEYLKERARNPEKKIQTYQFLEGHHFKGKSYDKGVQDFTVEELVYDLAQHLTKQDFYPNRNEGEGDLLIVVHFGVTDYEDDMFGLLGIENMEDLQGMGLDETSALDTLGSLQQMNEDTHATSRMNRRMKAHLLGINNFWDLPSHLRTGYEYRQMMRESRYFVVLMAFDYQRFLKQDEAVLLWSTRYNIRSAGQSFETAITEMNLVGSDYFGKNFAKLTRKRSDDKSRVVFGEIEVIENEPSTTDSND